MQHRARFENPRCKLQHKSRRSCFKNADVGRRHGGRALNSIGLIVRRTTVALLCIGLCAQPVALAASDDDIAELKRAIEELKAQNRQLARRLATLEGEKSQRRQAAPPAAPEPSTKTAQREPEPQPVSPQPSTKAGQAEPQPPRRIETVPRQPPPVAASPDLEQRVRELEMAKAAQENAVRSIIGDSFASWDPTSTNSLRSAVRSSRLPPIPLTSRVKRQTQSN